MDQANVSKAGGGADKHAQRRAKRRVVTEHQASVADEFIRGLQPGRFVGFYFDGVTLLEVQSGRSIKPFPQGSQQAGSQQG